MKLSLRIWVLIFFIILSLISMLNFQSLFSSGVIVKDIEENSTVFTSGIKKGEIITSINNNKINNFEDYSNVILDIFKNSSEEKKLIIDTKKNQYIFFTSEAPKITVSNLEKTKIKMGLDLQGGARALVKPEKELTSEEMRDLIAISLQRLNIYGVSDISIRQANDLSGNSFMIIEVAGATSKDLQKLIAQQGKFEAKIANQTVFTGGENDITYVCRNDANCAGISQCDEFQGSWVCKYEFSIHLSENAAKKHADITRNLNLDPANLGYLDKQIEFYIDDIFSTSLFISENLKGLETTQVQIQGSGSGTTKESAFKDAESSMKQMQTILITGSLPYKLEIVKLDTISPILGKTFVKYILLTTILAFLSVSIIIFIRYRNIKASLALLITSFSEVLIILGFATGFGSSFRWVLDLPSIVGILVMIGTGVDQQIVILDEALSKKDVGIKEKLKRAKFIIIAAYFTSVFSLLPLWNAGAGLLRGFMVTTIIGLTIGVFITRPAFADMIKIMDKG